MDLRSGRHVRSRPLPQHDVALCHRRGPGGADRASNLSDDLILLVLARLRCARTAVRTGLLSRRWRGLWTRLTDLAFSGVPAAAVEAAFSRVTAVSPTGAAFHLDIHLPSRPEPADVDSLLRAAALISPVELVFTIAPDAPYSNYGYTKNWIQLPCFQHATSIELDTEKLVVQPPPSGEFPALERLSMSGKILHIDAMVTRCPRLRVLVAKFRRLDSYSIIVELDSLKRSLCSRKVVVSLIDISISGRDFCLLRGAANLSPQELVYTNTGCDFGWPGPCLQLPLFDRTTSIKINQEDVSFTLASCPGKFLALERLCLFGCNITDLGKFLSRCPRLRVLRVSHVTTSNGDITVHSTSLQELVLGTYKECRAINIVTPALKQMTMEVHADGDLSTSVSAPLVDKILWRRSYTGPDYVFGFWLLRSLILETAESNADQALVDDTRLQVQLLPRAHVLTMDMCASDSSAVELNFAREIEKLPVTDFSVVELRFEAMRHVYGITLLRLLEALPVHNATKILKITLLRAEKSKVTRACIESCPCDEPKNWRSQSVSLPYLEEVEIIGFKGEDHGFDFVKVILRCAPMLKRVTMKMENKTKLNVHRDCTKKTYNISMAYPSVNFYVYLSCGTLVLHPGLQCS